MHRKQRSSDNQESEIRSLWKAYRSLLYTGPNGKNAFTKRKNNFVSKICQIYKKAKKMNNDKERVIVTKFAVVLLFHRESHDLIPGGPFNLVFESNQMTE